MLLLYACLASTHAGFGKGGGRGATLILGGA